MVDLARLPEPAMLALRHVAIHESAHAVATVALGFALSRVSAGVSEQRGPGGSMILLGGETESSATAVRPECADRDLMRRASVVALAARAARRRQDAASPSEPSPYERHDLGQVLTHLGLPQMSMNNAEAAFASETREADLLLADEGVWRAVQAVGALLMERADLQSESPLLVGGALSGEEATSLIHASGVETGSWQPSWEP
jgi:hypothetical protein